MVKEIGKVYETDDYDLFNFKKENREVDRKKVEKLKNRILEDGRQLNPIIVNSRFEIYEGQHRFVALSELGWTIKYIIDRNLQISDIRSMNISQNKWSLMDFIHTYSTENENYRILEILFKKYSNFGCGTISLALMGDSSDLHRSVKNGTIVITPELLKKAEEKLTWLNNVVGDLNIRPKRPFELTLLRSYDIPQIDRQRLAEKVRERIRDFPFGNSKTCEKAIQECYNRNLSEGSKIYFEMEINKLKHRS